jgi:hypothetical protein
MGVVPARDLPYSAVPMATQTGLMGPFNRGISLFLSILKILFFVRNPEKCGG